MDIRKLSICQYLRDTFEGKLVFVGGVSEMLQGIVDETKDIDIVVTDITPLINKGHYLKSNFRVTYGNRMNAWLYIDDILIDISVATELPAYIEVNGFKIPSVKDSIAFKKMVLEKYPIGIDKDKYNRKIKLLEQWNINLEKEV